MREVPLDSADQKSFEVFWAGKERALGPIRDQGRVGFH
jgi:hypothetical protein